MFYLLLLIGLICSKKYWTVAKISVPVLISSKILFLRNPYKNPNERRWTEFFKNVKKLDFEKILFKKVICDLKF